MSVIWLHLQRVQPGNQAHHLVHTHMHSLKKKKIIVRVCLVIQNINLNQAFQANHLGHSPAAVQVPQKKSPL